MAFGRTVAPPRTASVAAVDLATARRLTQPAMARGFDPVEACAMPRGVLAAAIGALVESTLAEQGAALSPGRRRELVTEYLAGILGAGEMSRGEAAVPGADAAERVFPDVLKRVLDRIDVAVASQMTRGELGRRLRESLTPILSEIGVPLNDQERRQLVGLLIDDMLGLGPLEPLLADDSVTDIMANGPGRIFVERNGRLQETAASFRDIPHMMSVVSRIVSGVGRRIDEASPLVDARLADGSRVNIIIPPLALDGPAISIRKFSRSTLDFARMAQQQNMSPAMAAVLEVAAAARLNILVSGGTGSGKTTLLNALSRLIAPDERVVTIEDAAELQLQQPHVVRLETRPANLEGRGEIGQRELLRNALRMRPDRIILGEIRGAEAMDMLQAMNTGHDGSFGTIHANRPREALTRLEHMVAMAGFHLPTAVLRGQIAAAIHLVVQVARMRDGRRRVTSISEVTGIEGDVIAMQELFAFQMDDPSAHAGVSGRFRYSGIRPQFAARAGWHGLGPKLDDALRNAE